jgi:hypothetical protein
MSHSIPVINYGISMINGNPAITFDLEAIENEIVEKYIFGRYPVEIDIHSFEFMGGQNIFSLITLISQNIKQETLSFDIWQTFDSQFEKIEKYFIQKDSNDESTYLFSMFMFYECSHSVSFALYV